MAIVPFKLWEDMKRWKSEQIQRPRLPPNPIVSATASLQRDLSSVMVDDGLKLKKLNYLDKLYTNSNRLIKKPWKNNR